MNNPKVLIVGNFLTKHGVNPQLCEALAGGLIDDGWDVKTTSYRFNKILRVLDMMYTILRYSNHYQVAWVSVFSGPSFIWAEIVTWLLKRLGKPYVVSLHGGNLPNFAKEHPERVKKLLNSANAVSAPSRYLVDGMSPYRSDINHIPNLIPIDRYAYHNRAKPRAKMAWLRAFTKIYNPTMAIEVSNNIKQSYPDFHFYMIGPDKDGSLADVKQKIDELGLRDDVTLPGRVDKKDISDWLNKADIFINTTNYDNTPVSVIEAMACGLCVVSTNVGGMPQTIEDGVDGLLVPPEDPDAMTQAVKRLLDDPEFASRISANARKRVEEYDWKQLRHRWGALFNSVAESAS